MNIINTLIETIEGYPIDIVISNLDKEQDVAWDLRDKFVLVLKGYVDIRTKDGLYRLEEDHMILINRGSIYKVVDTSYDNITMVITIDPEHFTSYYPNINKIELKLNTSVGYKKNHVDNIQYILGNIVLELLNKKEGYELTIVGYIQKMMGYIIKNYPNEIRFKTIESMTEDLDKLADILSYINYHIYGPISLGEISESLALSENYLSRFIKDQLGISLTEYMNIKRLEIFTELLKTTDKSITEISYEAGFISVKQMNKVFKKYFRKTPTQFKEDFTYEDRSIYDDGSCRDVVVDKVISYINKGSDLQ